MTQNTTSAQPIDASTTNYCATCASPRATVTAHAPARRAARKVMGTTASASESSGAATAFASLILLGGIGYIGFQVLQIGYHAYLV